MASQYCLERYRDFRWLVKQKTTYPMFLLSVIALFLNADQNLVAPNLTQIAREFNFTDVERDRLLGGQLNLGFLLVGGLAALFSGWAADRVNRTLVFAIVVVLGEFSCFCTLFVKDYWGLFASRAFTGMAIGGASPLIYSIIGDMYGDTTRGKAVAFIQVMLSLGIIVGQSVAGFIGPADVLGWRAPFVAISVPSFILAPLFYLTTKDPPRGGGEKAVKSAMEKMDTAKHTEIYSEKFDLAKFKMLLRNKSAWLFYAATIFGALPWGVIFVFFQDYFVQNVGPRVPGGISVQQSTSFVLAFGVGAIIGIIFAGIMSDRLWKRDHRYPLILGACCTTVGAIAFFGIINGYVLTVPTYALVTVPSAILVNIAGSALRMTLLNVTLPETRGTAFAFYILLDDVGRALGPLWVSLLIEQTGSRTTGINISMGGWFFYSFFILAATRTVIADAKLVEDATRAAVEGKREGSVLPDPAITSILPSESANAMISAKSSQVAPARTPRSSDGGVAQTTDV